MRPINPIHLCIKSAKKLNEQLYTGYISCYKKNITPVACGNFVLNVCIEPISKQVIIIILYYITHKDSSINKNKAQAVVSWNLVFLKNSVKHFIFQL